MDGGEEASLSNPPRMYPCPFLMMQRPGARAGISEGPCFAFPGTVSWTTVSDVKTSSTAPGNPRTVPALITPLLEPLTRTRIFNRITDLYPKNPTIHKWRGRNINYYRQCLNN